MKQLKVAIIGQGRSGRNIHGRALKTLTDRFKIVAVAEKIEERRKRAEQEYGCKGFDDYRELFELKDLDIIVNSSFSHMHVPITLDILNNGFNVLCEKPLAGKAEEVDKLIGAANRSGKLFAIFQQSRFAPYYLKVKEVIDSGILGRIIQISIAFNGFSRRWDWQCAQGYNGGNLLNTGPHPLDQALRFLDIEGMPKVTCIMDRATSLGDAEGYVKLILQAPERPVIDLEISSCCAYPSFTYNVQGIQGGLKGSMDHIDWMYFKPEEAPKQEFTLEPIRKDDGAPSYCQEELIWYKDSWDVPEYQKDLHLTIACRYYQMLYKTLTEGAPLEITPQQVRQQIAVIEECHRQNPMPRFT